MGQSQVVWLGIAAALGFCSNACSDSGTVAGDEGYEPTRQARQAEIRTVTSTDMGDVRAAIAAAGPGDTVKFLCGEYIVDDEGFYFKSDVAFVGPDEGQGTATFKWDETKPTKRLEHVGSSGAVKNVTIRNITFENIALRFQGTKTNFGLSSNVYLKNVTFRGGKGDLWGGDGYVTAKYSDGVVLDGCTLLRSNKFEGGRGIRSYFAHNTIIKDSFIGTTKDLPDGAPDGWFRVAINVLDRPNNESDPIGENVKVHNTVLRRIHDPDCSIISEGDICLSHAIYAGYYDGLELTNNWIDGWASVGSEDNAKLRNSENTFVFGNHFMRAGMRLYTDTNSAGTGYEFLRNVHVRGNRFDISQCSDPGVCGIRVRREGSLTGSANLEQKIYLVDNTFADLGVISLGSNANGSEFCIEHNAGASNDFGTVTGVRTSGCSQVSWDRPLAGVFSGDFNNDGTQDTATRVKNSSGAWTWRVYVSDGDHYQMLDFGDGTWVSDETAKYGVHVGDFTGNGKDDITYYGRCGSGGPPCWRVHASQGTSFVTKTNFGDGMFHTDETLRFGVHVGDFDGDGKDDLMYRGQCGSPAVPCWRVQKSTGTTFTVHNFGDDANWYGEESEIYGLLIGNFDGDAAGRDDVAYLGKCGSSRCIRVHLSTGSAFVYQANWDQGAGVLRDGPEITEHFGMKVGDMNEDGKADIGYRGRCGSSSKKWRYHRTKPTGDGFEIMCSDDYLFK